MANTTVTLGITDQLAMHYLLEEGVGLMEAVPEDSRVLWLRGHTLRLHPLPALLFPSGHVAFVQRLPWRRVGAGQVVGREQAVAVHGLGFWRHVAGQQEPPSTPCRLNKAIALHCALQAWIGPVCGARHVPALLSGTQHAQQAGAVQVGAARGLAGCRRHGAGGCAHSRGRAGREAAR